MVSFIRNRPCSNYLKNRISSKMKYFTEKDSIIREIWGKADTVLFIFAGAAAEFTLNRAVDWLYYTGRLPADPLGRLFSTVAYSRMILFSDEENAFIYIDQLTAIHQGVENSRGTKIPAEAYLEVLYMLVEYSIRAYELLEKKLKTEDKAEIFDVFARVGNRMALDGLAGSYIEYLDKREQQLTNGLFRSNYTKDLYLQYRKHLGYARFLLLKQVQLLVAPEQVNQKLKQDQIKWIQPILKFYKILRFFKMESWVKTAILPKQYARQLKNIETAI